MAVACMNQTRLLPIRGGRYSWRGGHGYRNWRKRKNVTSFALVCLEAVIFQLDLEEYNGLHGVRGRVRGRKETCPPTPSTRSLWVSVTLLVALVTGFLFLLPQKTKPDSESQLTEAERAERAV